MTLYHCVPVVNLACAYFQDNDNCKSCYSGTVFCCVQCHIIKKEVAKHILVVL